MGQNFDDYPGMPIILQQSVDTFGSEWWAKSLYRSLTGRHLYGYIFSFMNYGLFFSLFLVDLDQCVFWCGWRSTAVVRR